MTNIVGLLRMLDTFAKAKLLHIKINSKKKSKLQQY